MKVVQICPYAMDRPGGVQRHVQDLSKWLDQQGHQTRIIAPPAPGMRPKRQDALIELGRSRAFGTHGTAFELSAATPWGVRSVAQDLRDWGAQVVHLHTPWTPMLAGQMWRAMRLPTLTTIHATLPDAFGASLIDRYIRRSAKYFLSNSQTVVTPSNAPVAQLQSFLPEVMPVVLPPAVDLSAWFDTPPSRDPEQVHLVFLGRLEARKGIDVLLDAWPQIAHQVPNAHLTIAGDGALRGKVEATCDARLAYIGAPNDDDARALLASADIFVAPATHGESYGLVLAEAMATGAVPIAAGNAGYVEVLGPEGVDLIVPPHDAHALTQKICELANESARLRKFSTWSVTRASNSDVGIAGPHYEILLKDTLSES